MSCILKSVVFLCGHFSNVVVILCLILVIVFFIFCHFVLFSSFFLSLYGNFLCFFGLCVSLFGHFITVLLFCGHFAFLYLAV